MLINHHGTSSTANSQINYIKYKKIEQNNCECIYIEMVVNIVGAVIKLIGVLVLVLMNGFFVAVEFAIVKVRSTRIDTLVSEGNMKARYAQKMVSNLNEYLSACQLGITLASLGLGWIGEPAVAVIIQPLFTYLKVSQTLTHTISVAIAFSIITALHIIIGELAPKNLSILKSEATTMFAAIPMTFFYKLMYPIIWLLNSMANKVLKLLKLGNINEFEAAHTDDEIRILVEESYKHGLIDKTELTFVDNIFDFSETSVKNVMTPRTDMVCMYINDPYEDILEKALNEQMTRYPACGKNKDNILGYVHMHDLYNIEIRGGEKKVQKIIRPLISVPETMSISVLLKKFQREKEQMAIVIDEYGGTAGLVTVEDIIEEIVGELRDEFDDEREEIEVIAENCYSVDGKVSIDDISDILDINIDASSYDTIAGWVYSKLESEPRVNEKLEYQGFEFRITAVEKLRIVRINISAVKNEN